MNTQTDEHETQVAEAGEADLHKSLILCRKNPGHDHFLPVEDFTIEHLPEGHRDLDLFHYIKAVADQTVRVEVRMTSPDRPECWPNSIAAYPFYKMRGKSMLRTGTGTVMGVDRYPLYENDGNADIKENFCPCTNCKSLAEPSRVWWRLFVKTASHVVFDTFETSHTSFQLFYNAEGHPRITLDQVCMDYVYVEKDMCELSCVTCDVDLGERMYRTRKRFGEAWRRVHEKYRNCRDVVKLAFIVSHPHGCSKQVSVGKWLDKVQVGRYRCDYKFVYTTCTCPGSSGASVHCLGYNGRGWWSHPAHSGASVSGLNYSGVGRVW